MRQTWWTPDPHPCLGGCGIILQYPKAKRCPRCNRAHIAEKVKVRYRERRERGVCVECGKVPAFQGGRLCEPHRERHREYKRKLHAKKQRRDWKFVNCEICGIKIKKITRTKYCRPCSVDRTNGVWHHRRLFARRKERGLCVICGRVPAKEDRLCCEECSTKRLGDHRRIYNERKRKGLCTRCGKILEGKTQTCEKCRRDLKAKDLRRAIRKDG